MSPALKSLITSSLLDGALKEIVPSTMALLRVSLISGRIHLDLEKLPGRGMDTWNYFFSGFRSHFFSFCIPPQGR